MTLDGSAIVALLLFSAVQTGTLIYWIGVVTTTLKDHERRLQDNEDCRKKHEKILYPIAAREGMQL
jgi:hypothetical protein